MSFFPDGMEKEVKGHNNPLWHVVKGLSVSAKKAMYAASKKGLLVRRTWDGCAFNAGSKILGGNVGSTAQAAKMFGMSQEGVQNFIRVWDSIQGGDVVANRMLIEAIEGVGIATLPGRGGRVIRGFAYKSEATKFAEQLESGELTVDMIPGCEEFIAVMADCSA